jgi:hypothetical protein
MLNQSSIARVRNLLAIGAFGISTNETIEQFVEIDFTATDIAKQYAIPFVPIVLTYLLIHGK